MDEIAVPSTPSTNASTPAEQWEKWRAERAASTFTEGGREAHVVTVTEQRRRAQKASVKARRQNKMLRGRDARAQDREARSTIRGLKEAGEHYIAERVLAAGNAMLKGPRRTDDLHNILFVNFEALVFLMAVLGGGPKWVRKSPSHLVSWRPPSLPPKRFWNIKPKIRIAWRLTDIRPYSYTGTPLYEQSGKSYWFKPHDLLDHYEREIGRNTPCEAVECPPLSGPDVIFLTNLPAPSPRSLARDIVDQWLLIQKQFNLPWDEEGNPAEPNDQPSTDSETTETGETAHAGDKTDAG